MISTLENIENLTRTFATSRSKLADLVATMEADMLAVKRRHIRSIRAALAKSLDAQAAVVAEINANTHLFNKPRTITVDGIRVGLQKGKGAIDWDDDEQVCKLIRKHLPDDADTLIKVTQKPIKNALKNLSVAILKKIGCRVEESGDEVVIKPQDSELDKLISRLLKDAQSI